MERWIESEVEIYRSLEIEKLEQQVKIDTNKKSEILRRRIKELQDEEDKLALELREEMQLFTERISKIETKQAEIKINISDNWNLEEKTYKGDLATVTRRTTTSLIITSKEKLVDFLVKNNQVEEGIKSFNIQLLKGFKKSKILSDEVVELKPNYTVSIKLKEDLKEAIVGDTEIMKEIEEEFRK